MTPHWSWWRTEPGIQATPLTVRLTNENLNINTLDDDDMKITDDDLAVLTFGDAHHAGQLKLTYR